jgi:hypothetical protein
LIVIELIAIFIAFASYAIMNIALAEKINDLPRRTVIEKVGYLLGIVLVSFLYVMLLITSASFVIGVIQ